jgi:hypothetical protein
MRVDDVDIWCSECNRHRSLRPPIDVRPVWPHRAVIKLDAVVSSSPDKVLEAVTIGPPQITYTGPCVFCYAVLEHLHSLVLAIRETERVLRPDGIFIGTVSQGEPFHASYFHHTVWGLVSLARSSTAMRLSHLWCGPRTLRSLATMSRYSRAVKSLLNVVDLIDAWAPWFAPRCQAWSHRDKKLDALYRAGSICFAMKKTATC